MTRHSYIYIEYIYIYIEFRSCFFYHGSSLSATLYSKDANLVHVTVSTFLHSLQLILKNLFFLSPNVILKKETTTQILQHGISPALFEFYQFNTFLNKQENFTFLPDRLPFLYERQCLKATSRKFPEINKNVHS